MVFVKKKDQVHRSMPMDDRVRLTDEMHVDIIPIVSEMNRL